MEMYTELLGSGTVDKLKEAESGAVLQIGKDALTRADLSGVRCWNFMAARRLGRILTEELGAESLKQVYDEIPPAALAVPQLGVFSLAVLGAAFESRKIGTLASYVKKHRTNGNGVVTWHTLKAREQEEIAKENAEKKRRQRARKNQAHQLRVARHEQRASA